MALFEVRRVLGQLNKMRKIAWNEAVNKLKKEGCDEKLAKDKLKIMINSFVIFPETLDPTGVFKKIEHILDVRDERMMAFIKDILPDIDHSKARNIENLIEATIALEQLYKIVQHYYLLSKRTDNIYLLLQLQMQLPLIIEQAKAYFSALNAFKSGIPIGDGIGALVASKILNEAENVKLEEVSKETVVGGINLEGRLVYVVKARGPGGAVGKPGEAVMKIIERNKDRKIKLIIMIDAAVKLEGEKLGEVVEGVGAAIGGVGVDKYKIEEIATRYNIPIYAIVIKESLLNAISIMRKEMYSSLNEAVKKVKTIILENSSPGDRIIVVGVGNTMGII